MKRQISLPIILVAALLASTIPARVNGAGPLLTLKPTIYRVELSGTETAPPGVSPLVTFLSNTAFFDYKVDPQVSAPQWANPKPISIPFDPANNPEICGLPDMPQATLTTPDGKQSPISAVASDANLSIQPQPGCWFFNIGATYGMQLGQYTITLNPPNDQLSYAWQIVYPSYPAPTNQQRRSFTYKGHSVDLLMGFARQQTLRLDFYTVNETPASFVKSDYYIASRTLKADANGALVVDLSVSRTAPFTRDIVDFAYTPVDAVVATASPTPASTPSALTSDPGTCPGFTVPSRLQIGGKARVTPGDPNLILSDPLQLTEGASQLGQIPAGGVMTVLDGPTCDVDILFWKVSYKGVSGWTGEGQGNTYWVEPIQ